MKLGIFCYKNIRTVFFVHPTNSLRNMHTNICLYVETSLIYLSFSTVIARWVTKGKMLALSSVVIIFHYEMGKTLYIIAKMFQMKKYAVTNIL